MQRRRISVAIMIVALAVVSGLVWRLEVFAGPDRQPPAATIDLPPPGAAQELHPGCNAVTLTFPDGTPTETVLQAVRPAGANDTIFREGPALDRFEGFSLASTEGSDLLMVNRLDAVWLCTGDSAPTQPPTPPNRFYGDVTIGGDPASLGTNVTGTIGGNVCGQTTVTADSTYVLDVVSSGQTAGCGTEGATVQFTVAGLPAGSETWHSGLFTELDLAAEGAPNRFFGDVTIDGEPADAGTGVTARIGGNPCGQTSVAGDSTYVLDVISAAQTVGCGTEGATVQFTVDGLPAGTATWHSGDFTELDLATYLGSTNIMAVDALPGCDVNPGATVVIDQTFDVDVLVTGAPVAYVGYNSILEFDPAVLAADGHSYQASGQFGFCAGATIGADKVRAGCLGFSAVNYTGPTDRITFHCVAEGSSLLHLVTPGEAALFSSTLGSGGTVISTALIDATIDCTPCTDRDGDTSCHDPVNDPDDDGCSTSEETALGCVFDPTYDGWYDVYDVPIPAKADALGANGTRDGVVDIRDVLAVLFYAFAEETDACGDNPNANGVDYDCVKGVDLNGDSTNDIPPFDPVSPPIHNIKEGLKYDRQAGLGPDPITGVDPAGPPDGVVDIRDALAALAQAFVVDCSEAP